MVIPLILHHFVNALKSKNNTLTSNPDDSLNFNEADEECMSKFFDTNSFLIGITFSITLIIFAYAFFKCYRKFQKSNKRYSIVRGLNRNQSSNLTFSENE